MIGNRIGSTRSTPGLGRQLASAPPGLRPGSVGSSHQHRPVYVRSRSAARIGSARSTPGLNRHVDRRTANAVRLAIATAKTAQQRYDGCVVFRWWRVCCFWSGLPVYASGPRCLASHSIAKAPRVASEMIGLRGCVLRVTRSQNPLDALGATLPRSEFHNRHP